MGDGVEDWRKNLQQKIVKFLKKLYNGELPLEQTLWKYSVFPWIVIYFISQLEIYLGIAIFNKKIGFLLTFIFIVFSYISWTGVDKIITDPLFLMVIKIVRFILLLYIVVSPFAMMFIFSGYQG